jgi:CRISPR-associated protein Csb2
MIALRIDFLNGTYHAAEPTAPTQPEWPPAPDRIFQALVAAAASLGLPLEPLTALEVPPELAFGDALATGANLYVPAAFTAQKGDEPRTRSNVGKSDPAMVGIADPVFVAWPDAPVGFAEWLRPVAAAVTHLGRCKSPVQVQLVDALPELAHRLAPRPDGDELLRVPSPGRLAALEAAFQAKVRPAVALRVAYADPRQVVMASPWGELLALRTTDEVPLRQAAQLAEATRAAVLSLAGDAAPAVLHGHDAAPHVAWGVLPDVGHEHAQGRILGVGAWLPAGIADDARTACALPLMRLDHMMLGTRRIGARRVPEAALPQGLTRSAWGRVARTWATVTPVVLDRHPKHGKTVAQVIADGVERAGYPRPSVVEVGQDALHRGVPVAREFAPRRPGRWAHVALEFPVAVRGPVLIGRERHFGMGLCRALPGTAGAAQNAA